MFHIETHDTFPPAKDERIVKLKASCTEVVDVITVEPGMADVVCQDSQETRQV
ncbi:hypothetical protein KJD94_19630 [Escherichia marmotae]|uniref:Uncharacterized protein n=1 Tax=Escherichia marmotae TaxID=1499973 RepID=A0ABU1C4Y0_9ESCH|nr:hypothetical protein [Escherichia marmotae]MDQ9238740.1 hypothetical protein [Escherichia marmotae]MDQ9295698.1 hypothetical protein [Escherichia marmotae]